MPVGAVGVGPRCPGVSAGHRGAAVVGLAGTSAGNEILRQVLPPSSVYWMGLPHFQPSSADGNWLLARREASVWSPRRRRAGRYRSRRRDRCARWCRRSRFLRPTPRRYRRTRTDAVQRVVGRAPSPRRHRRSGPVARRRARRARLHVVRAHRARPPGSRRSSSTCRRACAACSVDFTVPSAQPIAVAISSRGRSP